MNSTFVWSESQAILLAQLILRLKEKRPQRFKGKSVSPAESSNKNLRFEYLSFVDCVMFGDENSNDSGKYWFNFWNPMDREAAGRYRIDNWNFFAKEFHSISFGGKTELKIKFLPSPQQDQMQTRQEIVEKEIDLLTDRGKKLIQIKILTPLFF
jgi:hypothetical protein